MVTQKVLYFTEDVYATVEEKADIAKLQAVAEKPFDVVVMASTRSSEYASGPIPAAYVAGTVPAPYDNDDPEEGPVYETFDLDNPPIPVLPTQYVLNDGDSFTLADGTLDVIIEDGVPVFEYTAEE